MKKLICVLGVAGLLGCCVFPAASRGQVAETDLMRLFSRDGSVWSLDSAGFEARAEPLGYRATSESGEQGWAAMHPELQFAGLRVWESRAKLSDESPVELDFILYNRGDAGDVSPEQFRALLKEIDARMKRWTRSKRVVIQQPRRTSGLSRQQWAWVYGPHRFDLRYSFSGEESDESFRAEYIRLTAIPFNPQDDPRKRPIATRTQHKLLTVFDLRERVERTSTGDVFITGIPMIDQGQKGYCAVATVERLMTFYGRDVDQHEIAQIANTSSSLGTNPETMFQVLRTVGKSMGLKITTIQDFEVDDILRVIRDYNRIAKKNDLSEIHHGHVLDLQQIYGAMDVDVLVQARSKRTSPKKRFKDDLIKHVNGGIPLAWSAMAGLVPETPELTPGAFGHMRILIGYNQRTDEVLYTDSWGPGHELKRMSLDHAWAITTGLFTVAPDNIRL